MSRDLDNSKLDSLRWNAILIGFIWTATFLLLGTWQVTETRKQTEEQATAEARAHFFKDNAFRLWATSHGRIYVPVTETTQPDPYLSHLPERDLTTPSGNRFTLINPATMVRQIDERFHKLYGISGRVTSFNPLRPENGPDRGEQTALKRFEQGEKEVFEFSKIDGEPFLRLMRPLIVRANCLLCHPNQGWKLNGNGGGVGIALPMNNYVEKQSQQIRKLILYFSGLWLSGLLGVTFRYNRMSAVQTVEQKMVETLTDSEARKAAILNAALDCIISIDNQGRILEFNPAAEKTFGHRRAQVLGRDMVSLIIPEEYREAHTEGMHRQQKGEPSTILNERVEVTALHADGHTFPVELTVTKEHVGKETVYTAFLRDITTARKMEQQLSYQATHDALTDLINRREFERRLEHALEAREGQHCILYMDLDQFKVVNDTSGHAAGDELLRQLSRVLRQDVRLSDTLARLGGDEFGLLLEFCSIEAAEKVANSLLKVVRNFQFYWGERRYTIGISIGVVPFTGYGETLGEIMSAADAACYTAKERGRNRIQTYAPNDQEVTRRRDEMNWVERITRGFEEDRFQLYRQTIETLQSPPEPNLQCYELLLRLKEDELLTPNVFLTPAERFGLMPYIDRWVVRTAFHWFSTHPDDLERLDFVTINLSGHSIGEENFTSFITQNLSQFEIPAHKICFEITETAAVSNLDTASRMMVQLQQLGCRFALDDFGSGMSSFGYLKNLPVDFLKIDGSFVREINDDPINLAMVQSINDIAQVLGKQTIAEFVETDDIKKRLVELGVDYVQGYAISKPEPLA